MKTVQNVEATLKRWLEKGLISPAQYAHLLYSLTSKPFTTPYRSEAI